MRFRRSVAQAYGNGGGSLQTLIFGGVKGGPAWNLPRRRLGGHLNSQVRHPFPPASKPDVRPVSNTNVYGTLLAKGTFM
jgi:hypothetical protein